MGEGWILTDLQLLIWYTYVLLGNIIGSPKIGATPVE